MSAYGLNDYARGAAAAMAEGGIVIPAVLLRSYRSLGLSDTEVMLLLQLACFRQMEGREFPTPDQIGERMGLDANDIGTLIRDLIRKGVLAIDERVDPSSGVRSEAYRWTGWYEQAAAWAAKHPSQEAESGGELSAASPATSSMTPAAAGQGGSEPNLFTVFEREFGRPLSPMELETISAWLDQDRYPEELIRFALKEAVFAGKLHFRYIDRILLEWSRNRIESAEEARLHARRFRGRN